MTGRLPRPVDAWHFRIDDMAKGRNVAPKFRKPRTDRSPYFLEPAKGGAVTVFRRPAGNRAVPKLCGTMPDRGQANALVAQLRRAESVVSDLFLEATDDGIEALEAVLAACREAVLSRGARGPMADGGRANGRGRGRRRRGRPTDGGDRSSAPAPRAESPPE